MTSSWLLPARVALDGDDLVWVAGDRAHAQARSGPDLLPSFAALESTTDETIVDYARERGVLCLCSHGLPASHNPGDLSSPPFSSLTRSAAVLPSGCQPVRSMTREESGNSVAVSREPLDMWRQYARLASLTLDAARALQMGRAVDAATWASLVGVSVARSDDGERLSFVIRAWLRTCDVRVGFEWSTAARPTFVAGSLLGAVALELAFAVSGEAAIRCASCGAPFVPARKPSKGRRSYCPTCRQQGAPGRDAARDYWHRKGKYRRRRSQSS